MEKMPLNSENITIDRCHRLGPKTIVRPQPIIAKFVFYKQRELIWANKKNLKGSDVIVKEDFPAEIKQRRAQLLPVFQEMLRLRAASGPTDRKPTASLVGDKLYVKRTMYTIDTLSQLPDHLKRENIATKQYDRAVWFQPLHLPIPRRNWHIHLHWAISHVQEGSEDEEAGTKIEQLQNPVEQKKVKVNHFDLQVWRSETPKILKQAIILKFEKHYELKGRLVSTGQRLIGEDSPNDDFWGIGLQMGHKDAWDLKKWTGQNIVGKTLMEVHESFK